MCFATPTASRAHAFALLNVLQEGHRVGTEAGKDVATTAVVVRIVRVHDHGGCSRARPAGRRAAFRGIPGPGLGHLAQERGHKLYLRVRADKAKMDESNGQGEVGVAEGAGHAGHDAERASAKQPVPHSETVHRGAKGKGHGQHIIEQSRRATLH